MPNARFTQLPAHGSRPRLNEADGHFWQEAGEEGGPSEDTAPGSRTLSRPPGKTPQQREGSPSLQPVRPWKVRPAVRKVFLALLQAKGEHSVTFTRSQPNRSWHALQIYCGKQSC